MTEFETKVLKTLLYNPSLFSLAIKNLGNHKYAMSTVKKYVTGVDFGIEIEGLSEGEIRIRYSEEKNIVNLYKLFMCYFPRFDYEYGIHIHIDCRDWFRKGCNPEWYPNGLLEYLIAVFDYKGKFNQHEVSYVKTAIRCHNGHKTTEYRIIKMPRSWSEFIKNIMICQYATKLFKDRQPFDDKAKNYINDLLLL